MKKTAFIPARPVLALVAILAAICAAMLTACSNRSSLPMPEWRVGKGVICGKIVNYSPEMGATAGVTAHSPIDRVEPFEIEVEADGTFCLDVPMFATYETVEASVGGWKGLIVLAQGDTCRVVLDGDSLSFSGEMADVNEGINSPSARAALEKDLTDEDEYLPAEGTTYTTDEFFGKVREWLGKKEVEIAAIPDISARAKEVLNLRVRTWLLVSIRLGFGYVELDEDFMPMYGDGLMLLFKDLGINDMRANYSGWFDSAALVYGTIAFTNETARGQFNSIVTELENTPENKVRTQEIADSLSAENLARLGIATDGPFRTAALATFCQQCLEDETALIPAQMAYIEKNCDPFLRDYFLAKNEQLKQTLEERAQVADGTIHDTPDCSADELLALIKKEHAGSPVMIDLWGTWCGPCLQSLKDFDRIKPDFIQRGVHFVYLTDQLSPEDQWRDKARAIAGHHYRMTEQQSDEIFRQFAFEGWPSYIILDRQGQILHAKTGYDQPAISAALEKALAE